MRKKRSRRELSATEVATVVHKVYVSLMSHKEVALEHSIKVPLVSRLVQQARKDRNFLAEMLEKESNRELTSLAIARRANVILEQGGNIWKAGHLLGPLNYNDGVSTTVQAVRKVLRHDLGLRFRKVKTIPYQGNMQRCLVLRQKYALTMIEILLSGKRVLNIDETFLISTDFRRCKWR